MDVDQPDPTVYTAIDADAYGPFEFGFMAVGFMNSNSVRWTKIQDTKEFVF